MNFTIFVAYFSHNTNTGEIFQENLLLPWVSPAPFKWEKRGDEQVIRAPRRPPPRTPIAHFQGDFAEKIQDRTGPFPKSAAKLHHLPPHGQGPETKQNRHHKQKTPSCLISLDKATIGTNLTPSSQRGGNKSRGRRGSRGHPSSGVALARTQCHILAVTYVWMGGCFGSECDAFVQDTLVDRSDRRKQNTNRNGERADRDLS
jgi:hypothetical protein